MKKIKSVFRTNVIYGVLVLVPLAVIVLLLAKIVEIIENLAEPLELQSATSAISAIIMALLLVAALLTYPPIYVFRLIAWGDSDAFDWQKFPG